MGITRPKGVGGRSLTIDTAVLTLRPGRRATDATLTIGLRLSRGGQHVLTVPAGARVQKVELDKKSYPVQQDGRQRTSTSVGFSDGVSSDGIHRCTHSRGAVLSSRSCPRRRSASRR